MTGYIKTSESQGFGRFIQLSALVVIQGLEVSSHRSDHPKLGGPASLYETHERFNWTERGDSSGQLTQFFVKTLTERYNTNHVDRVRKGSREPFLHTTGMNDYVISTRSS